MNALDNVQIDETSFSWLDLLGIDRWKTFTVSASLTLVGTPTYVGRYKVVGKQCHWQISAVASTSIAITAGTHYFALPITPAKGITGTATMSDDTTNTPIGSCHTDVATGRVYPPAQAATGSTLVLAGNYEIG